MKKQHHIWLIEKRFQENYYILDNKTFGTRSDARKYADYFNGFSKGKRSAQFRVKKYIEV